ncbi:MAG: D-alanyl-D-alanine carboxypeptidase/D-alanyl-D-alanine-endopeptidase [Gemmatimonadota bacterium]|nr:D-alanyl-D-alanine carboxypeptidase/D-alanyl-D-alanine-endopeptidase [Gemmatimonadota bacterium]MDH3424450.1 D-alanyl-D-alanine carboxypeptidase/D-alanyl-D-alanine-endopeptidase [Gemmatimonadota bacterium]
MRRTLLVGAILAGTAAGASAQEIEELQSRVAGVFGSSGLPGATWGAMIVSLDSGDTLFALAPDSALTPASNLKLLTTAAALRILGPEFRFRTYVLTDGTVAGGVVDGDLVLYGTGDPGISDRFYQQKDDAFQLLVDQLEALGIHTVTGDIVGDASFFTGPLRPPGWDPRDLNDHFTAAVSALSFNENVVSFRVVPGAPGEAPSVTTVPAHSGMEVVNNAETVAGQARPRLAILRDDPLDPVRVEGRIVAGTRDVWREMTVSEPARFAAATFRAVLEERGITLQGGLRTVEDPDQSILGRQNVGAPAYGKREARVLARHVSQPLTAYLDIINHESNNLFAELLFRSLGRSLTGEGSPAASGRAVRATLLAIGADLRGLVQEDGSGLSAGSRVSASTFVSVLERMAEGPYWAAYWTSLPEAGQRRGLSRMYSTAAAGNLRAKTGTIEGVSALSGVVRSGDGERLAFSLLVNEARSTTRAKRVENQIGVLLASFQRAPGRTPTLQMVEAQIMADALGDEANRHRVSSGENLSAIAGRYRVSLNDLLTANPRLEGDRIVAGQWIEIPGRAGTD